MDAKLIDVMGNDLRVVNAARVSFSKESEWEWEYPDEEPPNDIKANLSKKDQKLIKYLAKNNHWTPFSHVQITMREKVPIFVARQRFKHMVGFTYNEVSRRYVDELPEFFIPDKWRGAPTKAKQGSSEKEVFSTASTSNKLIKDQYDEFLKIAESFYLRLIEADVAPEQARMVLPQSMYTEYYVTGSLAAWARAYLLRIDPHAQKEIQDLASQWNKNISSIDTLKYSWSALIGKET